MHRLRTVFATVIVVLAASLAHAFEFPSDAEFIVTDAQGVIVAIGRTVAGTAASVEVWSGFEGPARLTVFLGDGRTRAVDVAIGDGAVTIEGIDLRVLLAEDFATVAVRFVSEPGADPPGLEGDGADESGVDDREAAGPDLEPPGQERRPEKPPGQERRPEEPPGKVDGVGPSTDRRP